MTGVHDYATMLCVNCGLSGSPPALLAIGSVWKMRCEGCGRCTHAYSEAVDAVQAWNRGLVAVSGDVREGDVEF